MTLGPGHIFFTTLAIQLVVTIGAFVLAAREVARNPDRPIDGPRDGYTLVTSVCAAAVAVFGVWGTTTVSTWLGFDVFLGGHNAFGLFAIAFFVFAAVGALCAVFGRGWLESRPRAAR